MPELSPLDHATAAIIDLSSALRSLVPSAAIYGTAAQPHPPIQSVVTALQELVQLYSAPLNIQQPAQQLSPSPLPAALQRVVPVVTHPSPASPSTPCDLPNILFPTTSAIASDPTQPAPNRLTLHSANSATLNLDVTGKPLTYATAIHGPDRHHWIAAEVEEFNRLFETKTLTPLHIADQPIDRRKDTTYYNPQVKMKRDESGNISYRIRGTIGRDRINYPGETTALTAAMPVVKLLLQAAMSENVKVLTKDAIPQYSADSPRILAHSAEIYCPLRA